MIAYNTEIQNKYNTINRKQHKQTLKNNGCRATNNLNGFSTCSNN